MNDREFIESVKNHSVFEHMREGFIVPKETYIRLVKIADKSEMLASQYQTSNEICEELVRQNKQYRTIINGERGSDNKTGGRASE